MPTVVVAGSEITFQFAVIDFTLPATATVQTPNPGFGSGCRVAIDDNHVAVGSVLAGDVALYDVMNPATPQKLGSVNTQLSGIGALAISGNRIAVGEWINSFQARVKLIDISNPASMVVIGTAPTPLASTSSPPNGTAAIASVVFLSNSVVAVSGASDPEIVVVDFTNPSAPVVTSFLSGFSAPTIDADSSANRITAGDSTSANGPVKLINAATHATLATANTGLGGVTSIALATPLVLAGSTNSFGAVRVNFAGSTPVVTSFTTSLGGGATTAIKGTLGACGDTNGAAVKLFNLAVTPPSTLGSITTLVSVVSTLGISVFTPPTFSVTPTGLTFGAVRVSTTKAMSLSIANTGTLPLNLSNIQSSSARFTFSPAGPVTVAPGGTVVLTVTFAPNAETGFAAALTMNTNDPAHASVSLPLSGTGALPHIAITPSSLNLANVPVCLTASGTVTIQNTGGLDLHVTSIATGGVPFSATPASATVLSGTTTNVTVTFTPTALGASSGTLSITSDDPTTATRTVPLTANAIASPPAITVTPRGLAFGATPVTFYVGLRFTVANASACQALNVTLTSSGAPFFVTDVDPTSVPPTTQSVSSSVTPGASKRFAVVFAPTVVGGTNGALTIASNDPNTPTVTLPLSGTGVQVSPAALELVLDRSGSMAGPAPGGTKMDALKAAVKLFADLVIPGQGNEMGSVQFDDAVNVLTPFAVYDLAHQAAIEADAATLTPRNMTSIGGGMQLGQAQITPSALGRKIIVVFTDGLENTPPTIASVEPGITGAGIEVYAVGLGQPQNISSAALFTLAASANGKFFQTDDTLVLRKNFVQVLADAYRNNMAADPIFTISQGQKVTVPVQITDCESRITFVLNWDNPASQIEMTIRAPDGTLYTPASPGVNQLVKYGSSPGYRYYQLALPPLDPGSGLTIGPAQIGTWMLEIEAVSLAGTTERCATNVMVESQLQLRSIIHAVDITTPVDVQVTITAGGRVVSQAQVTLTATVPLKSLVTVSTPQVVQRALNADHKPIRAGGRPLIPTRRVSISMKYSERRRAFVAQLSPPRVDGVYQFEVQATGKACGGTFDRYSTQSLFFGAKPNRGRTSVSVTQTPSGAIVTITPRDAKGKPLGAGLGFLIHPEVQRAVASGVIDHGDGTYSFRVISRSARTVPSVQVRLPEFALRVPLRKK